MGQNFGTEKKLVHVKWQGNSVWSRKMTREGRGFRDEAFLRGMVCRKGAINKKGETSHSEPVFPQEYG